MTIEIKILITALILLVCGLVQYLIVINKLRDVSKQIEFARKDLDNARTEISRMWSDLYTVSGDVEEVANFIRKYEAENDECGECDGCEYCCGGSFFCKEADEEADEEVEPNKEPDIHMIAKEEFLFNRDTCKYVLEYDEEDGTIKYASTEVIENVPDCVGEALHYFGVNYRNPNRVYVRNEKLGADFCIRKVVKKEYKDHGQED